MLLLDTCALLMLADRREDCDRIIIATALEHRMPIITADQIIPQYPGIKVIW
jgi:PIN domain nuclease of toxin-antitoxin system